MNMLDAGASWSRRSTASTLLLNFLVLVSISLLLSPSLAVSSNSRNRRPLSSKGGKLGSTSVTESSDEIVIPMPNSGPKQPVHNQYLCSSVALPPDERYIVKYVPRVDPRLVHHMLLFGCEGSAAHRGSWDCKTASPCLDGSEDKIIYAWALNASGLELPDEVGYKVGPQANIRSLVVQVHIGKTEEITDWSKISQEALAIKTTRKRQKYVAGIFILGAGSFLAAGKKEAYADAACRFRGPKNIYPLAFRTHAHSLGTQIVGYVVKKKKEKDAGAGGSNAWKLIGTRSPQDPQAFYLVKAPLAVEPTDILAARCVYNTEKKQYSVMMGPDSEDEMCNFYIMYFTKNDGKHLYQDYCWSKPPTSLHFPAKLPPLPVRHAASDDDDDEEHRHSHSHSHSHSHAQLPASTTQLPTTQTPPTTDFIPPLTSKPKPGKVSPPGRHKLVLSEDWPLNGVDIPDAAMGQVSAVAVDTKGGVHVLHRGPVTWDFNSFRDDYVYQHILDGPIKTHTLIHFSATGKPLRSWGSSQFYMPHGLTIDHKGSFWVTDVALHQVFKFAKLGDKHPTLILGKAFHPGHSVNMFCQPSSVAVERSGSFYVSDGYCNHRIMKFSSSGILRRIWDEPVAEISLFVPHKAILNAAETILYVADRENYRVLSYDLTKTSSRGRELSSAMGGAPYSIAFNRSVSTGLAWPMFGVFGGQRKESKRLMGFTLDSHGKLVGSWGPTKGFSSPHDLAVDPVHQAVYITEIGPNRIWKFVPQSKVRGDPTSDLDDILHLGASQPKPHPQAPTLTSNQEEPPTTLATRNYSSVSVGNKTDSMANLSDISLPDDDKSHSSQSQPAGTNVGIVVTVVAVAALALIIAVGVIKEYRHIKFKGWRLLHSSERNSTIGVKSSGTTVRREKKVKKQKNDRKKKRLTPYNKLQSVLGQSKLGFSRLKTYDSDSEEEEFPVFNRV